MLSTENSTHLLCYALGLVQPPKFIHSDFHTFDPNMVVVLFLQGANPHEYFKDGDNVWQGFLHQVAKTWQEGTDSEKTWLDYSRAMQILLKHAPEPVPCAWNPRCPLFPSDRSFLSLESIITNIFFPRYPEEAAVLRKSLEARRSCSNEKRKQDIVQDLIVGKKRRIT